MAENVEGNPLWYFFSSRRRHTIFDCDWSSDVFSSDLRIDHWGVVFDRRPAIWIAWIWAGGGDVLCADGRRASGCLDSPVTVTAIRWYASWVAGGPVDRKSVV